MPTKILSAALSGLEAEIIEVEADSGGGDFGQISIVGLPDTSVSEAKERVKSALRNCGCPYPRRKITVNLAPADLKKHGPTYDLPIAISILALKNKFDFNFLDCLILGELSLNGEVKSLNGILAVAMSAQKNNIKHLFVPENNAREAKLITALTIFPVKNLNQIIKHFSGHELIIPLTVTLEPEIYYHHQFDLAFINGQEQAKRALEITAAGGHNLLLFGPPGSGKTLLAKTITSILPNLSLAEKLEITRIYSVVGELKNNNYLINTRPFRSPHHSASSISLVGGGTWPRPDEISLAHRGVLFLDEFPEFSRSSLENLRQPLEDGEISINRAARCLKFPANFMLVAAMNPCPCGYKGDKRNNCRCEEWQINNYRRRLSGPIIDRIDLHIEVPRLDLINLDTTNNNETSLIVRQRIEQARSLQIKRFTGMSLLTNAEMTSQLVKIFCPLDQPGKKLLEVAANKLNLSARSYFRVLKLARTIADLASESNISVNHLAEALQYRPKVE